jgi:DNA-directed RNA polymerase specialized sigma24 family protein
VIAEVNDATAFLLCKESAKKIVRLVDDTTPRVVAFDLAFPPDQMSPATFVSEKDFFQAYDQHADVLFRHAYLRTFDREHSKEFLCEAFKRLWLFIADGSHVDSLQTFLYRAIDALITESYGAHGPLIPDAAHCPAQDRAMFAAVQHVPPAYRRTVILHYIDGFSAEDISTVFGGSPIAHARILEEQQELLTLALAIPTAHAS